MMLRKLLVATAAACLFTFSSGLQAANVWHVSKIALVYPNGDGNIIFTFEADSPSCAHASDYHYLSVGQNSVTQEGFDNIYAAALAAAASGVTVRVNFDSASSNCQINRIAAVFGS